MTSRDHDDDDEEEKRREERKVTFGFTGNPRNVRQMYLYCKKKFKNPYTSLNNQC